MTDTLSFVPSGNALTQRLEHVDDWNWQKAPQGTGRSLGQAREKPGAHAAGAGARLGTPGLAVGAS